MPTPPGGTLTLADDLVLSRVGYGTMQLAGPGVFGPPKDRATAIAVLRAAIDLGITHIDTSDYYGPVVVNEMIKQALYPYPPELRIVTKVGYRRSSRGDWNVANSAEELTLQIDENRRHLGLEALDVVNLRLGSVSGIPDESVVRQFTVLAGLQEKGLVRHLGVSNISSAQLTVAQSVAPVVTVQNMYNVSNRQDDALVDRCIRDGIAYTPFFPLGGFSSLQSRTLARVAARVGASAQQVALAWLLQRSPTIVLIPGTSSVAHLRENTAAGDLHLPDDAIEQLDGIASGG
jgi:pyridoxine 4-dehydrogenase